MEIVDDRGVVVRVPSPPQRIVSLVPSTTETLFDLGLGDRVVGVTRFCVAPEAARERPKVGGTKDVDVARVAALTPDLVVGNCEENTREAFDALADVAPLYAAFPRDVDGALADLLRLGAVTRREAEAAAWHRRVVAGREALHAAVADRPRRRAAYLIWRRPWMAVSPDTFIAALLREAGLDVVPTARAPRFPELTAEGLRALDPDLVLLSSEPFPFQPGHADELSEATGIPRDRFVFVDGATCSWHGTRLARALPALARQLGGQSA